MARNELSQRPEWQGKSAARGHGAEDVFSVIMEMHLSGTHYRTEYKPVSLRGIYGTRSAGGKQRPHGIRPEYAITNELNGKSIFVEIKRQRAAGNAHERACKYMMLGILASAREIGRHSDEVIPFWWIFTNGIASDQYYRQEIMHWFKGIEANVLLWTNVRDKNAVIDHFDNRIRPLLE